MELEKSDRALTENNADKEGVKGVLEYATTTTITTAIDSYG